MPNIEYTGAHFRYSSQDDLTRNRSIVVHLSIETCLNQEFHSGFETHF